LNTHKLGSLYEAFEPAEARRIAERLELHYTPKHGSWLDMAEIEIGVMSRQCLNRKNTRPENLAKRNKCMARTTKQKSCTCELEIYDGGRTNQVEIGRDPIFRAITPRNSVVI